MKITKIKNKLFGTRKKKIISVVILLLLGAVVFAFVRGNKQEEQAQPPEEQKFYSQITGNEVSEEESKRPILGAMMENSRQARPQTGLSSAGIVFESVTEGGITRYLALFQETRPKEIGPVRSVRPPFVNWVTGFDAAVAHVGGSTEGLNLIKQLGTKDLDQFKYPGPYYRVNFRPAPHNMYANIQKLVDLQKDLGFKSSNVDGFTRSDDSPLETPIASTISINYSSELFAVQFKYDKTSNTYKRFLAGEPHIDAATNKQIAVKNLVVMKVQGNDSNSIKAVGSGKAVIYKDGNKIDAIWKLSDPHKRIELYDATGNPISLNRGNTWFAVVPSAGSFSNK